MKKKPIKLNDNMMKILLLIPTVVITAWNEDYSPIECEAHSYRNMHWLTFILFKKRRRLNRKGMER